MARKECSTAQGVKLLFGAQGNSVEVGEGSGGVPSHLQALYNTVGSEAELFRHTQKRRINKGFGSWNCEDLIWSSWMC